MSREHRRSGHRLVRVAAVVVALAVLAFGGLYLDLFPGARPTGPRADQPPASQGAPVPHLALPTPPPARLVLGAPKPASLAKRAVADRLDGPASASPLGPHRVVAVAGLGQPGVVWETGRPATIVPASLTKLLTTTAALSELGPETRFFTSVNVDRRRRSVVLVGGGDPLLAVSLSPAAAASTYPRPATLRDLARQTAAELTADGVRRVQLGYDATLFSGPAVNPHWRKTYVPQNVVSPITALWVNEGRRVPDYAQRVSHPALFAAQRFAAQLASFGVKVVGQPAPRRVAAGSVQIASVASPPLYQLVEHVLSVSDNEGAEVLLRQLAIGAGLAGSAANGVRVARQVLGGLAVPLTGVRLYDGSGLSRQDRIPARTILGAIQAAAAPDNPGLRAVVTGLPVAGFSGSLAYRFVDDSRGGVGVVRAKTGTLTGVHGLAGLVLTRNDQVAVFVAAADEVRVPKTLAARADLDRIATALSGCGC